MTDHTNEDVAVAVETVWQAISDPAIPTEVRRAFYRVRDHSEALQARLEAASPLRLTALTRAEAERDEARADARRLAEAARPYLENAAPHERLWNADDFRNFQRLEKALAAHEPHLTGPKHRPIGTFYTTEDAVEHSEKCEREARWREHIGALPRCVCKEAPPDDAGPPAPGEGDDLPNPELGMGC